MFFPRWMGNCGVANPKSKQTACHCPSKFIFIIPPSLGGQHARGIVSAASETDIDCPIPDERPRNGEGWNSGQVICVAFAPALWPETEP